MAVDPTEFHQMLSTLLSTENVQREEAEKRYNDLSLDVKVANLMGSLVVSTIKDDVRLMAAVLLRRLFASDFLEFYGALSPGDQLDLRVRLLQIVHDGLSITLRQKVCEVVAEVARNLIDDEGNNQWPELLQFLFDCANSTSLELHEAALRIFTAVPNVFGTQESQYQILIHNMLQHSLDPQANPLIHFQAVRAVVAYILFHEKDTNVYKLFADLLPRCLEVIAVTIENQDDQTLLKLLIDLTESVPKFLRPQIVPIFDLSIKVFGNSAFEDSWRHLALEVIVSTAENAPAMVRKHAEKYVIAAVPLVLQMMTDLEDDENWSKTEEVTDDDNGDNNVIAESALDRLACGLGGKAMLPHIIASIPTMLSNADWKHRHAALMAISAIGEGCHKQMEAMLDDVMGGVLNFLNDPHPRVRYAACNAIGQMSTDFAPTFEKRFHEQVLPGLLRLLDDTENPRVQAHAGAALVNFSEDCPKHILTKYLDDIMAKLENILTTKFKELVEVGTKMVLEQVVTTIASVADTTEKDFSSYYDRLMPCLKYIIENGTSDELRMLRGKTIECVSLIGLAVGKEKFAPDANDVMALLLRTQQGAPEEMPDDDPQTSYLISAWARMCKILGKEFEQYLPMVMAPVMKTAAMKPEVAFLDNDEVEDIEGDNDWSFINLGEQQNFAIRTAGMEDKASACEMLVCYARELKEGFVDFAEDVVKLMVPMLKFYFHDGVRSAAAESLPYLLDCAKIRGPTYLEGMWRYICPELLRAIGTEPELIAELLNSLAKCVETLGANCLPDESIAEVLRLLVKYLDDHFAKMDKRAAVRRDEDYDEGVEEQLADEDDADVYLLSKIADVIHALFKVNGASFIPHFNTVVQKFAVLLSPERPWADRQWGLCIFDDVIEFTGESCIVYKEVFLTPIYDYTLDVVPEVRQAAIYGCGVLAQFGGLQFKNECTAFLTRLFEVIGHADSRKPENINPTENAISSVAKILKTYNTTLPNFETALGHWVSYLPVTEDQDEAPHIYGYLCDLVIGGNAFVLGPDNANVPQIVAIIAEAFRVDVITGGHEEGMRMVNIVKQAESDPIIFQKVLALLTEDQKKALEVAYREAAETTALIAARANQPAA